MKRVYQSELLRFKKPVKSSWWIPLWKGLVFDAEAKHRRQMGPAIWVYLYLLFVVNRKSGGLTRKQSVIAKELGLTVSTVQKHLMRLKKNGYITTDNAKPPAIKITKWKLFYSTKEKTPSVPSAPTDQPLLQKPP